MLSATKQVTKTFKKMNAQTFAAIEKALENANLESLLNEVVSDEDDTKAYGLSFDVETDKLQFINYLHNEDKSFERAFESQNPCIIIGYVDANEAMMGDPASRILDSLRDNVN